VQHSLTILRKYKLLELDLGDKLKSVRQLVDLLLTGNLSDLLDPNKKKYLYGDL
jgi:hypothetical protein